MKKEFYFFVLIAVVLTAFLAYLLFSLNNDETVHTQEMPVSVNVVEKNVVGVNIDTDSLKFGSLSRGNSAIRDITIINPFKKQVNVLISFEGGIADWISIPQNSFVLNAGERNKFPVTVAVPEDAEPGNYTSILKVVMKKA